MTSATPGLNVHLAQLRETLHAIEALGPEAQTVALEYVQAHLEERRQAERILAQTQQQVRASAENFQSTMRGLDRALGDMAGTLLLVSRQVRRRNPLWEMFQDAQVRGARTTHPYGPGDAKLNTVVEFTEFTANDPRPARGSVRDGADSKGRRRAPPTEPWQRRQQERRRRRRQAW